MHMPKLVKINEAMPSYQVPHIKELNKGSGAPCHQFTCGTLSKLLYLVIFNYTKIQLKIK